MLLKERSLSDSAFIVDSNLMSKLGFTATVLVSWAITKYYSVGDLEIRCPKSKCWQDHTLPEGTWEGFVPGLSSSFS